MTEKHKVLVNTSTLIQGGGLQVAAALILHAIDDPSAEHWQFLVSKGVARELQGFGVDTLGPRFHVFENSPARNSAERRRVLAIEAAFQPDLVFTLFGPAYVRFRSKHLCGVADPWVTHSSWLAFRALKFPQEAFRTCALMLWKAAWWKAVDYWWTEAQIAKDGLVRRLRCDPQHIFVIPNTTGPQFSNRDFHPRFPAGSRVEILCLSAYYRHKNLELLPDVAREIERLRPKFDFRITVTLPDDWPEVREIFAKAKRLGVAHRIVNLARVPVSQTPDLYARSHLSFLPSLLEVFSAVYPESLCTGVPLVTTDLRFARDVCKDAAVYFEPASAKSAAQQIVRLAENESEWNAISARGRALFLTLPDASRKWEMQRAMINEVASR